QFVISWIGSVNRDEEVFERPDVFDIRRQNNHHLAFGFGPHYCLGASLASLEAQVAVDALLDRTRSFRRTDAAPLPLHPSIVFRGGRVLPLEVELAGGRSRTRAPSRSPPCRRHQRPRSHTTGSVSARSCWARSASSTATSARRRSTP